MFESLKHVAIISIAVKIWNKTGSCCLQTKTANDTDDRGNQHNCPVDAHFLMCDNSSHEHEEEATDQRGDSTLKH